MGLEAVVTASAGREAANAELSGPELALLIGRHGSTLEALQEVTRAAVQRKYTTRALVDLDIEGYRARRREILERRARSAAAKVRRSGKAQALELDARPSIARSSTMPYPASAAFRRPAKVKSPTATSSSARLHRRSPSGPVAARRMFPEKHWVSRETSPETERSSARSSTASGCRAPSFRPCSRTRKRFELPATARPHPPGGHRPGGPPATADSLLFALAQHPSAW